MNLTEMLKEFEGGPLDVEKLSSYEKWALTFFQDEEKITDPCIDITMQLDITDIERAYRQGPCKAEGASLTAYLYWGLIQAMNKHPCFYWRVIDKKWYSFKNLPLTFVVAVGGNERFNDVLIKDVCRMGWEEFCKTYRQVVDNVLKKRSGFVPVEHSIWTTATFIGNQPDVQFTGASANRAKDGAARPLFYFGRRYNNGDKLLVPFFILFDHSNLDPYVISLFLKDYCKLLTSIG